MSLGRDPLKLMCIRLSAFKDGLVIPAEAMAYVEVKIANVNNAGLPVDPHHLRAAAQVTSAINACCGMPMPPTSETCYSGRCAPRNVPARGFGPKAIEAVEVEAAWRQVCLLQALETAELPPNTTSR